MAHIIVGIHGLANKPKMPTLKEWWKLSLDEGLAKNSGIADADYRFELVYWADLLYKYPLHSDAEMDFDQLYNRQPYLEAREGALEAYAEGWLDVLRSDVQSAAGTAVDFLRKKLDIDRAGQWLLEKKLKDLAYYYDEERRLRDRDGQVRPARQVLMGELERELLALEGNKLMVIAHSMGSIIAYDVLRNIGRKDGAFEVADFVTIGAPLGLPHVKQNIYEERKSYAGRRAVRTPSVVVGRWRNYADKRDPVAFDSHLRDDYAANDRDVRVEDDLVLNDYLGSDAKPNHHKSYGYLRTPELSAHVARFLAS